MRIKFFVFIPYFLWLLVFCGWSVVSQAQLRGSLTGTSDYIWQGYSKSDRKPALQANIDYEFKSGIYLGSFASTVDFADDEFSDRANAEFRPYVGWAYKFSDDWRFNAEWIRYIFNGKIAGQSVDYNEFYFYGHFRDLLSANFGFSEDSYQQGHMSFNYVISGRYPITDSIEISGTFGYANQLKVLHYDILYWHLGFTWYVAQNMGFDVRFYEGDEFKKGDEAFRRWQFDPHVVNNQVIFSVTYGF